MARYGSSRVLPVIIIIIIVIVAVAGLVSLSRAIFFSGEAAPAVVDSSRDALLSTTAERSVRMTVRGPIVADESFRSYQITITPSSRSIVTYKGYLESVIDQVSLPNNVAAYDQFVHALDKANLPKGAELQGERNDLRGICATGQVNEFEILNNNESVKMLWTSTCSGSKGSLDASVKQLSNLFEAQIPNVDELTRSIKL
jgi:hypothetical protein